MAEPALGAFARWVVVIVTGIMLLLRFVVRKSWLGEGLRLETLNPKPKTLNPTDKRVLGFLVPLHRSQVDPGSRVCRCGCVISVGILPRTEPGA